MKLRSSWKFGMGSETRRGLLRGMGYSDKEIERPLIAIVNSWNEYNPGHVHLNGLANRIKQGVREAGGFPLEVPTTAICDGMVLEDPKYIELPSRNLIADQVELNVEGNMFDAMVMICTCDSIVPGHLMAAARLDIPTIIVTGGYMPMGEFRGEEVGNREAQVCVGMRQEDKISKEDYEEMIGTAWGSCGACGEMTTANSMCFVAEAMGMTFPGNSSISAVSSKLLNIAYQAGKQILKLLEKGITARDIITEKSVRNAINVDMAVAGSTNLLLHIPAIAQEAGLDKDWWKVFDLASHTIPLLAALAPSGPHHLKHFDLAGGLPALMKNMLSKLDGDCLTITGKSISENVKNAKIYNSDVIKDLDNPADKESGIGVLYGNLAPEGAIVKIAAVQKNLYKYSGMAKVFDSLDGALDELRAGKINKGDAVVIRYLGPKGRFGTTAFTFQEELRARSELFNSCAIITDGRFSGATSGLSIGYVSPEAALGGVLAVIKNGDTIDIDISERKIEVKISEEEINSRLKSWKWTFPKEKYSRYLNLFSKNISSTAKGAIWRI